MPKRLEVIRKVGDVFLIAAVLLPPKLHCRGDVRPGYGFWGLIRRFKTYIDPYSLSNLSH
jgi:hypothetical protein